MLPIGLVDAVLPLKNADYPYFRIIKIPTCPYANDTKKVIFKACRVFGQLLPLKNTFSIWKLYNLLTIITANHTVKQNTFTCF